jgi:hypothetical protein
LRVAAGGAHLVHKEIVPNRAGALAEVAVLAEDRIARNRCLAGLHNRAEAAFFKARPATHAIRRANNGRAPAAKLFAPLDLRRQHQRQIRRIHVTIGQHGVAG